MDNSIRTPTQDNSARLWDSTTGAEVGRLKIGDSVNSAEFSPDGTLIVVASSDHTARIWDISRLIGDKGAFALACAMLGNDTDLFDIRAHYGLGEIAPICGDHKPLPVDWPKIE